MMGQTCLALALLLAAVQDWTAVVSKEGGFKVKMPGKPTEKKQTVKTAAGKDLNVTVLYAEGSNDAVFAVSYTDYTEADLKKGSIDKRLDYARDGAAASAGGIADKEETIKLDGHPGREFAVKKNGTTVARMRIYLVNRRLYQVMVLGALAKKDETNTFLDSFGLNK